ncbi:MAG: hypothetical protein WC572_00540 [Candidatus Omnitrophota bacterium]
MRKALFSLAQLLFLICLAYLPLFAEDGPGLVRKGNNSYRQKQYDQALKFYNEAQIKSPGAPEIEYNIGIARYEKGDYPSAVKSFEKATFSKDKVLESKANFNIANSKYKLGKLKENTDLQETVGLLRQSLDYYKRAIELDSKDTDSRVNHELVEKELKRILDKLKQEQDKQKEQSGEDKENREQDKSGRQGSQQGEGKSKQDSRGSSGQEKKEEEDKGRQEAEASSPEERKESGEDKQEAQAGQVETGKEENAAEPSSGQPAAEAKEMSEREAKMLLDGYRQDEGGAGRIEDRGKGGRAQEVLKDW